MKYIYDARSFQQQDEVKLFHSGYGVSRADLGCLSKLHELSASSIFLLVRVVHTLMY